MFTPNREQRRALEFVRRDLLMAVGLVILVLLDRRLERTRDRHTSAEDRAEPEQVLAAEALHHRIHVGMDDVRENFGRRHRDEIVGVHRAVKGYRNIPSRKSHV